MKDQIRVAIEYVSHVAGFLTRVERGNGTISAGEAGYIRGYCDSALTALQNVGELGEQPAIRRRRR